MLASLWTSYDARGMELCVRRCDVYTQSYTLLWSRDGCCWAVMKSYHLSNTFVFVTLSRRTWARKNVRGGKQVWNDILKGFQHSEIGVVSLGSEVRKHWPESKPANAPTPALTPSPMQFGYVGQRGRLSANQASTAAREAGLGPRSRGPSPRAYTKVEVWRDGLACGFAL